MRAAFKTSFSAPSFPLRTGPAGQGAGFRVQGSGVRVQGSGFRVQGSGSRNEATRNARFTKLIDTTAL